MNCDEFQSLYAERSDIRAPDPGGRLRLDRHRQTCRDCARFADALDLGIETLRGLEAPPVRPSFERRLRRRLRAEVAIGDPVVPTHAGLAAGFLLAAALSFALYEGLTHPAEDEMMAARVVHARVFADSGTVPAEFVDVSMPAFSDSRISYSSTEEPLSVHVLFAR